MCLRPVKIYNNSRKLGYGKPFIIEVPCGECAECKKLKKNEYTFRAYYTVKEVIDNGGYVYFDTLTYDNDNLPHVSEFIEGVSKKDDFSCFRVEDYRKFLVRLRRYLEYYGFDVKHNLKYFLTSEYGTSEKGTHRPHYHILFFVTADLDPFVLSEFVNKAWNKGRTDGLPYQSRAYVKKHVFGKISNMDEKHIMTVCHYVAKYVAKDCEFQRVIDQRIHLLCKAKFGEDYEFNYDVKKYILRLKRCMCQFHKQSQGFGLYGLSLNDPNKVMETGMMSMPDPKNIVKHTPLCGYLKRKLFYDLVDNGNGKKEWVLNELGKIYRAGRKKKAVQLLADRFSDWHNNLKQYLPHSGSGYEELDGRIRVLDQKDIDEMEKFYKSNIDRCLDGRSWTDFAVYMLFYKGRVITPDTDLDNGKLPDLKLMFLYEISPNGVYYNYSGATESRMFGCRFVSLDFSPNSQPLKECPVYDRVYYNRVEKKKYKYKCDRMVIPQGFSYGNDSSGFHGSFIDNYKKYYPSTNRFISSEGFSNRYCYNESSHESFRYFDELYQLYCRFMRNVNIVKQDTYEYKEYLQKKLKKEGFFVRSI